MKIDISPIYAYLAACVEASWSKEFSGYGYARKVGPDWEVYDFRLMDIGSEVFTQFSIPFEELQRPDAANMKVWIHRHPLGNGIPGPCNWSGTDNRSIAISPLGTSPKLMQWSISIVLTPGGWVGRIDNHLTGKTKHLEVIVPEMAYAARAAAAEIRKRWVVSGPKKGFSPKDHIPDWIYQIEMWRSQQEEEQCQECGGPAEYLALCGVPICRRCEKAHLRACEACQEAVRNEGFNEPCIECGIPTSNISDCGLPVCEVCEPEHYRNCNVCQGIEEEEWFGSHQAHEYL